MQRNYFIEKICKERREKVAKGVEPATVRHF